MISIFKQFKRGKTIIIFLILLLLSDDQLCPEMKDFVEHTYNIISTSLDNPNSEIFEEAVLSLSGLSIAAQNDLHGSCLNIIQNSLILVCQAYYECFCE